jgi:intein/homing endonuclease
MESFEILEQGSYDKSRNLLTKNTRVYDLEIEDNHNYFVNGILVSNCHYVSNTTSQRTQLLNDVLDKIPKVWLLTGTPMTSRPINYYNLLKIVKSPLTLDWKGFVYRYCGGYQFTVWNGAKSRKVWKTTGATNLDELRERTKNLVLRRLKTDVLDLPEKIVAPIFLELQNTFYNEEIEEFMRISKENKEKDSISVTLNRLMKIRQLIAIEKIPYTCELIDKFVGQGKKVIVFTNFTMSLDMLHEKYKKNSVVLDGRMSLIKKQNSIDRFQTEDKIKIFFANLRAGGVGHNLTAAEAVIMNDLCFVPADHSQAEDRCVYEGQLILTNLGYKKIEDIKINDKVYTHKGNFQNVIDIHSHLERKKKRIDIQSFGTSETLSLTDDHLLYVYNIKNVCFEWVKSKDLDIFNHRLTLKVNKQPTERKKYLNINNYVPTTFKNCIDNDQKNSTLVILPEKIELTNELLYAFGFFIAEGWAYDNDIDNDIKKSSSVNVVQKITNEKMYDASQYIINIFKKSFNIINHSEYIDKSNCKMCTIYSKNLSKNFINWFGYGSENKKMPVWVNELNNEQLKSLIDGFNHGDGYYRKNIQEACTTSSMLASQLVIFNANLERTVSFKPIIPKLSDHKKNYVVSYSTKTKLDKNKIYKVGDYITYGIKSLTIKRSHHNNERVYDLSVENDHSFVVNVFNVHNCYRHGQKKGVMVYYPIFDNTIEINIYNILQRKKNIIDQVLGDGEYSESFAKELIKEIL